MTIHANTLSELRDKLNEFAGRITPDTPVPWDIQFKTPEGEDAQVSLTIQTSNVFLVTPRIDQL
jgi:hypothetical protein